ncbi:MAG: vanadium-dependent haloperoxidase [Bacteroidetes bacterium]|nr:vanadium-dependent haloperoxidase [Bacteroidota bacterium]
MAKRHFLPKILGCFLLAALLVWSCKTDLKDDPGSASKLAATYDAEASLKWNKLFLEVERYAAGYRPGPAPRSLALMGLATYEACITGMPDYNSLKGRYSGLVLPEVETGKEYHWPTVVHAIYANMMPKFFTFDPPSDVKNHWNSVVTELDVKYLAAAGQEVFDRSKAYGESVGEAMWAWAVTDPYGHDAYKDPFGNFTTGETYDWTAHYDGPGDWEPTYPGPGKGMGPFFGKVRTFAITDDQKLSLPPSVYFMNYSEEVNSEYYSQALQTYTKNAETSYDVEWIGEFWSDDLINLTFSPGPRWIAIARQVIEHESSNLQTAVETFAKIGMALNDAAVACWNSKYIYNVERPDTYIRKVIDPNYKPNLYNPLTGDEGVTPSFPAYPSGHSTMGASAAEALASVFGYSYAMTDRCHEGRNEFEGVPRSFTSFEQMAEENAWSRVLLGVHWRMDADEGVRFGKEIGQKVNALPWRK